MAIKFMPLEKLENRDGEDMDGEQGSSDDGEVVKGSVRMGN